MKRCASGMAAVVLVLSTGACLPGRSDEPHDPPSSSTGQGESSADGPLGRLVAGDPPSDVAWASSEPPADWKQLDAEAGTKQWQVGDSKCAVTITQPNGLGTGDQPTDDDLADEQVRRITEAAHVANATTPTKGTQMVPAKIKDVDGRAKEQFATRTFEGDDGFTGLVWARRYGDFAMLAFVTCGGDQFDTSYADSIKPFLDTLVVTATY